MLVYYAKHNKSVTMCKRKVSEREKKGQSFSWQDKSAVMFLHSFHSAAQQLYNNEREQYVLLSLPKLCCVAQVHHTHSCHPSTEDLAMVQLHHALSRSRVHLLHL